MAFSLLVVKKSKFFSVHSYFQMSPQVGSGGLSRILKPLDHPGSFLSLNNSSLWHKSSPKAPTITTMSLIGLSKREGLRKRFVVVG